MVGIELDTIRTETALTALPEDEWDAMVRALPRPSPFFLHCWLLEWWRHFGEGSELVVHVARRHGRLVAALPLVVHGVAGARAAVFPGGSSTALGDVLLAEGEDVAVAYALARGAFAGSHHFIDLQGVPAESRLVAAAPPGSLAVIERVEAPVLDLSTGWDAVYQSKTGSKKRNLHRRRRRQLSELGRLETVVARRPDELEPALEDAFVLHDLRWRGRPDTSDFGSDAGRRFHRKILRELGARDLARLVLLRLDGRTIAFHYYFALAGTMVVHRLAFDPALGRLSPGLVNTLDALEAASEEGLRRVEFLGGNERYKLELADGLEPLHQTLGLPRGPRGVVAVQVRLGSIRLRRRLKQSRAANWIWYTGLGPARRIKRRRPVADA